MKTLTSAIWSAPGTFPLMLALACAGRYERRHEWHFEEPAGLPEEKTDDVGHSLMTLASDLAHESSQAAQVLADMQPPRFGKKRKARYELEVIAAKEKLRVTKRRFTVVRDLAWAYIHATHPAYSLGMPSESDITAHGSPVVSGDAAEHPLAFPQNHLVGQTPVFIVRIIAGNDDQEQTGTAGEFRANAHIGDRDEPIGEPIAAVEDNRLKRLMTLGVNLTDRDLGLDPTVRSMVESGQKKMSKVMEFYDLIVRAFWALASDDEIVEHETNGEEIAVRDDWSIVSRRRERSALHQLLHTIGTGPLGLPDDLVNQTLERLGANEGCGDPNCPVHGHRGLPDIQVLSGDDLPPELKTLLGGGEAPKDVTVVRRRGNRRQPTEPANAG